MDKKHSIDASENIWAEQWAKIKVVSFCIHWVDKLRENVHIEMKAKRDESSEYPPQRAREGGRERENKIGRNQNTAIIRTVAVMKTICSYIRCKQRCSFLAKSDQCPLITNLKVAYSFSAIVVKFN